MTSESHATLPNLKPTSGRRRRRDHNRSPEEKKHRRRRKSTTKVEPTSTYVYRGPAEKSRPSRITVSEERKLGRDGESSSSEEDIVVESDPVMGPRKRKIKVLYMTEEEEKAARRRERREREKEVSERPRDFEEPVHRSRSHRTRRMSVVEAVLASPPKRSVSTRDPQSESRLNLKRSNTLTTHVPSSKPREASLSGTTATKRSSFMGTFFGSPAKQHHEPERLVECLACLSDDIPRSKSAKLKCGHRMCHPCLRRIFKLSVTDPQHMPPKCCTSDHIPLKHVERLFDINFKKNWNRKFQEYSTKNRIYCPGRQCGEWIKPGNIHKADGRKFGKCGRCKTKVCCLCNGKWHGMKDCPKDEETNRLLAAAKDAGWQRCYSCRTMVELKEGCNHMTCRCKAEFCMICGLKWKSCNCPWFTYDAVEADRLNHMQIPLAVPNQPAQQRPIRLRRPRPANNYHDEPNERRHQEREDEALARRLQRVAVDDHDDDYQGGIGDVHGIGNGAGHFMNQDYIRAAHDILTGPYDHAAAAANYVMGVRQARGTHPQPPGPQRMADRYPTPTPPTSPPMLRRHSVREQAYNTAQDTRPSERVVPARIRRDYESEAAVHAPLGRESGSPPARDRPRVSVLAGLGARGGNNRVNAWRTHIEPGVIPAEGVLSQ